MTGEQTKKFIEAAKTAQIKNYQFDTDLGTHLYNNDHAFNKFVEADEIVYNIRNGKFGGSHNGTDRALQVVAAWTEDIHEARISGTSDQISTFLKTLGVELSDSDLKIMVEIDKSNVDIIPATGDYNRFVPLTKKQYDALSDKEKEEYDKAKAAEEKRQHDYIGQNVAASITLG